MEARLRTSWIIALVLFVVLLTLAVVRSIFIAPHLFAALHGAPQAACGSVPGSCY